MSRPRALLEIDGDPYTVRSFHLSQPEGFGGGTLEVEMGRPSASAEIGVTSRVVFRAGYAGRAGTKVLFDTSYLASSQYTIETDRDSFALAWRARVDHFKDLSPAVEREVWPSRGRGLRGFMRWVLCDKLGYADVAGNMPNVPMPREVPILCTESYLDKLYEILNHFKVLVAPDDPRGVIYVYWLDTGVEGVGVELPLRKGKVVRQDKEVLDVLNQALLRYYPTGRDGRAGGFDCGGVGDTVTDQRGDLLYTSRMLCGEQRVDLGSREPSDLERVETVRTREAEADDEGVDITESFFVFSDDRKVPFRKEENHFAQDAETGEKRRVAYKRTDYYYLGGTNYTVSSGQRVHAEGLCRVPQGGPDPIWVRDLVDEEERIVSAQYRSNPGVWERIYSIKTTKGRALYFGEAGSPGGISLEEADRQGVVDTSFASYQTTSKAKLKRRVETTTGVGTQSLATSWMERDYLKGTTHTGVSDQSVGRQPRADDAKPAPVEELFQNTASIAADLPRKAEVVDATWIGSAEGDLDVPADALTGREWGARVIEAKFRRAGKRSSPYGGTYAKVLTRLHRGALVVGTRRGGAHAHRYVLSSLSLSGRLASTPDGPGLAVETEVKAIRLDHTNEL